MKKYSDMYLIQMVWGYAEKHVRLFVLIVTTLIVNVTLGIVSPYILNVAIEQIRQGVTVDRRFLLLPVGYIIFNLISWVFRAFEFAIVGVFNARVTKDIRDDAFSRIFRNKMSFFNQQKSGELTSRVVNDIKELSDSATKIARVITDVLRVLLILALLFYFSPVITAVISLTIPVIVVIAIVMGRWERSESKKWRQKFGEVNARFSEIMSKIAISKSFNRENENLERFKELNEQTFKASVNRGLAIFLFWPITDLMRHAVLLLTIFVGTWQLSLGLPLSSFVMFVLLLGYFYWPIITIVTQLKSFQSAFASLERIARVSRDTELEEIDEGTLDSSHITGRIDFQDVTFAYNEGDAVLHNISFSVKPGERVALVGHTGAGKSTIASLMVRFYEVSDGRILIDGEDIRNYRLDELRRAVGLVSQRVLLFKGTIRENLQLGCPDATDSDIWHALDMVQAREFIEALPQQLDFMVDENGKNLSAGQKQMISFARVLLSDPKIIVLDEATSAVDLYTESKIQDAIDTIMSTRTSISIAHRLTTIIKSDKIIVLERGRIVQEGAHSELVNQDGPYAEMYSLYLKTQSAKYLDKLVTT